MSDKDAEDASDMSDIVERLREMATGPVSHRPITAGRLCKEAAAEIERLRAALNQIGLEATAFDATSAELLHEVAAIARAALSPLPAPGGTVD